MKRICLAISLSWIVVSCSKSNNSSPSYSSTLTFSVNGAQVTFTGTVDTTNGIAADVSGVLPGSGDSATVVLNFLIANAAPSTYLGYFYDTSAKQNVSFDLLDIKTNVDYQSGNGNFKAQIVSNNGQLLEGTFQGEIYLNYGPTTVDSLAISNGTLTLSY
jgi:hypothetical protein